MRILIATITAGGGHLQAAAALDEAWRAMRPRDVVEKVDLQKFFSPLHKKVHTAGYVKLVEHAPEVWGMLFKQTDNPKLVRRLAKWRKTFPPGSTMRFIKYLKKFKPDVVFCTHYLPVEILGKAREEFKGKAPLAVCIVTDFEAHALWMGEAVDFYCVAAEETKARLVARGRGGGECGGHGHSHRGQIFRARWMRWRCGGDTGCGMICRRCWCWAAGSAWGRWRRSWANWTRCRRNFKRWWWRGGTRSCGGNWRCMTGNIRRMCWDS